MTQTRCPICDADVRGHYAAGDGFGDTDESLLPTGGGTCLGPGHHQLRRNWEGASWDPK